MLRNLERRSVMRNAALGVGWLMVMPLACSARVSVDGDVQGNAKSGREAASPGVAGGAGSSNSSQAKPADAGDASLPVGVGGASNCTPGHWVLSGQVANARDLGGIPLSGGYTSACSRLFRGGPLAGLTDDGCSAFAALSIRTIIDLRIESERTSLPDSACAVSQANAIWAPLPIPYALSALNYIADLNTYSSMATVFEALGDVTAYPIYFHCTYGRDRTGVLAAVILLALGASREDILLEYELTAASGLNLPPDSLDAVLDNIEQRGGIGAYLREVGVSDAKLGVLRSQAIAR
jgi:protein-tyrosine phosphatase